MDRDIPMTSKVIDDDGLDCLLTLRDDGRRVICGVDERASFDCRLYACFVTLARRGSRI